MSLKSLAAACLLALTSQAVYLDSYKPAADAADGDNDGGKRSVILVKSNKLGNFTFGKLPRVAGLGDLDIDRDVVEIDDITVPAIPTLRTKDPVTLNNILNQVSSGLDAVKAENNKKETELLVRTMRDQKEKVDEVMENAAKLQDSGLIID